ncbi:MAG: lysylphosphatidylglycerol synthase transmembrane domain-containing protein [bacterium]
MTALLLWLAFRGQDLQKIVLDLRNANYLWVIASAMVSIVAHYIRGLRWKMLIKPLGHEPSNANTYHAVMVGYLANLAVPRMGEISRCGVLNRTNKIPLNSLIGTVIIERIIDVLFLLSILVFSILLEYSRIFDFIKINILIPMFDKFSSSSILIYVFIGMLVIAVAVLYIIKAYHEKLLSIKLYNKLFEILIGFKEGILSVIKMEKKGLFIVYSAAIWILYILSTYLCYFAIESTSNLSFSSAIFVMAVGGIGMSAPVQGGIGAYEATVQLGLLVYGIAAVNGLAYATLNHSSQILSILIFGSISLLYIFLKFRKNKND